MDHVELIRQRGGIRPVARALGHKNPSTVQGWVERRNIPPAHFDAVRALQPGAGEPTRKSQAVTQQ